MKMIEKLGITTGWRIQPLSGKYYGTKVGIGGSSVKLWGNREWEPSPRELEQWGLTTYDEKEHQDYEITCDGHYEDICDYRNALLIAAAPNMLEALIELVIDGINNYTNAFLWPCSIADAERYYSDDIAVIEKATGRTWEEIKEML